MSENVTVCLCMIVKNEEFVLKRCLESVKELVDEIIIVDTGSTDHTKSIASQYQAQIYDYVWDNDFAKARNYAISKSNCDWLLLMDADEEFNRADIDKFKELLICEGYDGYHFNIYNYFDEDNHNDFSIHYAFRLLRNHKGYQYRGAIHEQIYCTKGIYDPTKFVIADVILFHYGYTQSAIERKNKRKRNLPLLLKQLEENPEDAFCLFNIGNEYMSQNQFQKALEYYKKAYIYREDTQAYSPHLFYRMILCFFNVKDSTSALDLIKEALSLYPECTDYEYCRAIIYHSTNSNILSVKSLKKCIEMGNPPSSYQFLNDCGGFRAFLLLGDIYFLESDYENALFCYQKVHEENKYANNIYYKIGKTLDKLYDDKEILMKELIRYLPMLNHETESEQYTLLLCDILINIQLYEKAVFVIEEISNTVEYQKDCLLMKIKAFFYLNEYDKVCTLLDTLNDIDGDFKFHSNGKDEYLKYLILTLLISKKTSIEKILDIMNQYTDSLLKVTYMALIKLHDNNVPDSTFDEYKNRLNIELIYDILETILLSGEYLFFEKTLPILNLIDRLDILTRLSKVYAKHDFKDAALKTICQSIKELNYIDSQSAYYLSRHLY